MSNQSNEENQGNEGSIWLKVQLSRVMHQRLKTMAVTRGGTLKGLVVQILADGVKCGAELVGVVEVPGQGPGGVVESKESPAKPKPVVVDGGGRGGLAKKYSAYTG